MLRLSCLLLSLCLLVAIESTPTELALSAASSVECDRNQDAVTINSSVILPCFERAAEKGVNPSIVRPFNLSVEIEVWKEEKHPTVIGILDNNGTLQIEDLSIEPNVTIDQISLEEYTNRVSLILYYRDGPNEGVKLELDPTELESAGLNASRPTKVIIHGYLQNQTTPSIQRIKNAYLAVGDYNVVLIDWSDSMLSSYSLARWHVAGIGDFLGQFLRYLLKNKSIDPETLHLVGFGLGAHIAGFAGKLAHADGWGVYRITGLDPSYPYFARSSRMEQLDRSDADIVDVIHTCTGYLGHPKSIGHLDFFPNEGKKQPGCLLDVLGTCSHTRALELFVESILHKDGFIAKFCDDKCNAEPPVSADLCLNNNGTTATMGEWLRFEREGRYILRTADSTPFGVGLDQYYPSALQSTHQ